MEPTLQVKKLSSHAHLPRRSTSGSAGYDLYAAHHSVVPAHQRQLIPLGFNLNLIYLNSKIYQWLYQMDTMEESHHDHLWH